jgi:hypothetical protein
MVEGERHHKKAVNGMLAELRCCIKYEGRTTLSYSTPSHTRFGYARRTIRSEEDILFSH